MAEAELVDKSVVEDFDRGCYKAPTARTYICGRAARANAVIIGHIDIKHEFALLRGECCRTDGFFVAWLRPD